MRKLYSVDNISFRTALIIAVVIFIIPVITYLLITDIFVKTIAISIYQLLTGFLAIIILYSTAKNCMVESEKSAKIWFLFAAGFLSFNIGSILRIVSGESDINADVSLPAGIAFFLCYLLLSWGILTLPQKKIEKSEKVKLILDLAIVFLSALFLVFFLVFGRIFLISESRNFPAPDVFTIITSLSYPVFDLMIIWTVLLYIFRYKATDQKGVLFFIFLSFTVLTVSDILLNFSIVTGENALAAFPNFGYVISFLLIGLAGVLKIRSLKDADKNQTLPPESGYYSGYLKAYLSYFWVIIIFIVLALTYQKLEVLFFNISAAVFGVILFLSILRQILTQADNINLNKHLKDIVSKRTAELTRAYGELKTSSEKLNKTYKELRNSELKYRSLVENSIQGTVIFQDGRVVYTNPAGEKITGHSFDDFALKFSLNNMELFFTKESAKLISDNLKKRIEGDKALHNYRCQIKHKNGNLIWAEVYTSITQYNSRDAIQLVFIDVTERMISEIEIQESEEKYRSLFESEIDAIGLIDAETLKFIDCNTSLLKLYGYSREEIFEIIILDLSAEIEKTRVSVLRTITNGSDKINLRYHRKKDGSIIPVEITSSLFKWKGRKVICGIFRDVSERSANENKLREFNKKLQESNQAKDKFFSIVAHDLRSPFHGLLGISHLISENYNEFTQEELMQNIKLINKSVKNVYNLVDNLLQWSRIQLGKVEFNPSVFDFYDSLIKAINIYAESLRKKSIRTVNLIKVGTFVYADETMIQSVIQNLLTNAIKFSHPGSEIKIESQSTDSQVSFSVIDRGIGIPKEVVPNLFNIDSQFSIRGTNNEDGTGLGLILCHELVEKNGGQMSVESEINKGSNFTFTLPSAGI